MASSLRHAARKFCGRTFPSISHGGGYLRRFSSSESPNLVNNNKHVPNSGTAPTSAPSLWSPRNPMFFPLALGCGFALYATCFATIYVQTQLRGGPVVWKAPDDIGPVMCNEPDDIRKKPNN